MNTNDTTDLTRASVSQRLASLPRFRTSAIFLVVLVVLLVGPSVAISQTIPTILIDSVVADQTVSLTTYNYPANQDFVVTMGPMGSMGINGYYVTTINSGAGGSFNVNDLPIPPQLFGSYQIAIRLQSAQGYYSYNWFYNNTTGIGTGGYTGIPTIGIESVVQDNTVTLHTHNFPAGQVFKWTMGPMGTQGINGIPVAGYEAWDSGPGGEQTLTLPIPAELFGSYQISIRAQTSHANPYYAYNWFYNNPAPGTGTGGSYTGYPTFTVCSVVQNGNITVKANNLPPNQDFKVTMGPMWTAGINGYPVPVEGQPTWNSGTGGTQTLPPLPIPSELYGSYQISVRMQTGQAYPYYAYNWFYNNNASGFCS